MSQAPTTDQIRNDIDSGETGEKIGFPDPAAAPLGTDAEAGGTTPTPAERKIEARARTEHREHAPPDGRLVYGGLVAAAGVAILFVAWLGAAG